MREDPLSFIAVAFLVCNIILVAHMVVVRSNQAKNDEG